MVYKVDKNKANFSQRNNLLKPLSSCNVTSMVMALSYLGYEPDFPKGKYSQPEDNLMDFLTTNNIVQAKLKQFVRANAWAQGIPGEQIHDILSFATNCWLGKQVTEFKWALTVVGIINEIKAGRPVVISGTFPWKGRPDLRPLGHIVCLVGYNEETGEFCYDDPYGKTYEWSPNVTGNDTWVSFELFMRDIKELGKGLKWAHLFKERV